MPKGGLILAAVHDPLPIPARVVEVGEAARALARSGGAA